MDDSQKSRIETLKQYISEDPADTFSQYALALEYAKAGNREEAVKILKSIIATQPDYLAAYYQLGMLYEQSHLIKEAADAYQRGIVVARQRRDNKTLNELRSALDALEEE
jgi:tetratricopeptide (TPR) repeat protein